MNFTLHSDYNDVVDNEKNKKNQNFDCKLKNNFSKQMRRKLFINSEKVAKKIRMIFYSPLGHKCDSIFTFTLRRWYCLWQKPNLCVWLPATGWMFSNVRANGSKLHSDSVLCSSAILSMQQRLCNRAEGQLHPKEWLSKLWVQKCCKIGH